jgi:azobenzene reductase
MKVAIILGSVRIGRQSHKIADYLEKILAKRGIEADLIDLAKNSLPIFGERSVNLPEFSENIQQVSLRLEQSDALLFITPEYHGSFSGVLKNALDHFWLEFQKKPIGVITVSAGKMGGINASTQLQHVILSLGAYPLPLKLLIPEVHHVFDGSFQPFSENIVKSTTKFLDEYLWFADAIYQKKNEKAVGEELRIKK